MNEKWFEIQAAYLHWYQGGKPVSLGQVGYLLDLCNSETARADAVELKIERALALPTYAVNQKIGQVDEYPLVHDDETGSWVAFGDLEHVLTDKPLMWINLNREEYKTERTERLRLQDRLIVLDRRIGELEAQLINVKSCAFCGGPNKLEMIDRLRIVLGERQGLLNAATARADAVELKWTKITDDAATWPEQYKLFLGYNPRKPRAPIAVSELMIRDDGNMWTFGSATGHEKTFPHIKPTHWMPLPKPPKKAP